ncbi:hypothetical protein M9H77_20018 [Catharanthus roseus]|uniref:Uncharacterized protein n=1 Tax=Catharanthus roseus TaxID=4058 RepID=A0ACC0AKA4_CATRO|nr:hypothetical protein M9H77_20018 [Catharanthus roseus]
MITDGANSIPHHRRQTEPSQIEPIITSTTPRVLTILSSVLEKLVARNDQLQQCHHHHRSGKKSLKAFDGIRAPSISIPKYLERIYKYTNCSPSCFVVGYVYIDRLVHKNPDSLVISLNIHRLLVTSVMLASKMLDDVHYNNAFFARVGGVSNAELNKLELELLFLLDFGVVVSSKVFESYCQHLEREMFRNGGSTTTYPVSISPSAITPHGNNTCDDDSADLPSEDLHASDS